jgi:hypothetical protein
MTDIVTWQEQGINLLATKYASKDPFYVNFKTVAKIIFFIYPILRCIGGLPAKVTPLSLTHQENHKKSASYQQITTKSIVNYNY